MLRGRFGDTSGRPYIEGRLIIPRLNARSYISFVVDTGADSTLLMPIDGQRMNLDYSMLNKGPDLVGVGGISRNFLEQAIVIFSEPGRFIHMYTIPVHIASPSPGIMDIPSLLGRDILNQWRMMYNPQRNRLVFKVLTADQTIPIR